MHPRALICLPTYNEAENLPLMVEAIFAEVPTLEILVIDDGSPDGTGAIADAIAERDSRVHVLHRTAKEGLGRAYIAGFRWALERDYGLVFEMDCDFSHQPKYLHDFLASAERADLVLGSRYISGGGTEGWAWHRRMLSRGGNTYARMILGLPFRDLTGGFKCFRREVLERLPLDEIQGGGYVFQIELTWRAVQAGFRVEEVPIVFPDRVRGDSKMHGAIVLEAVKNVWRLRLGV
ncbi:MAG: polyprenol monophosphomannose synthase [Deltaproteobacteria bacterium]|nr:polyprenol monophosphomannose synthase [Deltaproteobacteria bacterium]